LSNDELTRVHAVVSAVLIALAEPRFNFNALPHRAQGELRLTAGAAFAKRIPL